MPDIVDVLQTLEVLESRYRPDRGKLGDAPGLQEIRARKEVEAFAVGKKVARMLHDDTLQLSEAVLGGDDGLSVGEINGLMRDIDGAATRTRFRETLQLGKEAVYKAKYPRRRTRYHSLVAAETTSILMQTRSELERIPPKPTPGGSTLHEVSPMTDISTPVSPTPPGTPASDGWVETADEIVPRQPPPLQKPPLPTRATPRKRARRGAAHNIPSTPASAVSWCEGEEGSPRPKVAQPVSPTHSAPQDTAMPKDKHSALSWDSKVSVSPRHLSHAGSWNSKVNVAHCKPHGVAEPPSVVSWDSKASSPASKTPIRPPSNKGPSAADSWDSRADSSAKRGHRPRSPVSGTEWWDSTIDERAQREKAPPKSCPPAVPDVSELQEAAARRSRATLLEAFTAQALLLARSVWEEEAEAFRDLCMQSSVSSMRWLAADEFAEREAIVRGQRFKANIHQNKVGSAVRVVACGLHKGKHGVVIGHTQSHYIVLLDGLLQVKAAPCDVEPAKVLFPVGTRVRLPVPSGYQHTTPIVEDTRPPVGSEVWHQESVSHGMVTAYTQRGAVVQMGGRAVEVPVDEVQPLCPPWLARESLKKGVVTGRPVDEKTQETRMGVRLDIGVSALVRSGKLLVETDHIPVDLAAEAVGGDEYNVGCEVVLQGFSKKPENNGKAGRVVGTEVVFDTPCVMVVCGEGEKLVVKEKNVAMVDDACGRYPVGSQVVLHSFKNKPENNGKRCQIVGHKISRGHLCAAVVSHTGERLIVKHTNMHPYTPLPPVGTRLFVLPTRMPAVVIGHPSDAHIAVQTDAGDTIAELPVSEVELVTAATPHTGCDEVKEGDNVRLKTGLKAAGRVVAVRDGMLTVRFKGDTVKGIPASTVKVVRRGREEAPPEGHLPEGAEVVVTSLKGARHLNGECGTVVGHSEDVDQGVLCTVVDLDNGYQRMFRPENLTLTGPLGRGSCGAPHGCFPIGCTVTSNDSLGTVIGYTSSSMRVALDGKARTVPPHQAEAVSLPLP